jgi:membrane-associated phospholipid phosphatase
VRACRPWLLTVMLLAPSRMLLAQTSDPPPAASVPKEEQEDERAKLARRILATEGEQDDLAWLYSRADEYSPSRLTGEPVPTPGLPKRGEGTVRLWNPRWRKFGVGNYILTGVAVGASAASSFFPVTNPWRRSHRIDEWGRRALGVPDYESGQWARDGSDLLLSVNLAFPFLVDSLIVGYWYRRSPEVATQTALISMEAMAVATFLQGTTSALLQRERPYGRDCGKTIPKELDDCTDDFSRYRSFFSGHTSMSFAAAAVTCTHHVRLDLFGGAADGVTCGAALGSATAVALLRVAARKHYLSDVAVGAVVGLASGFGVPELLHYGGSGDDDDDDEAKNASVSWSLYPMANGMAVGGIF